MNKIKKAFKYAKEAHKGQVCDEGTPFIYHPTQVFMILESVTDNDDILCASLLHDVIEDTQTTYEDIEKEFGTKVANLVNEVTHEGKKDSHGYYFPRLKTKEGIMIKLADTLSNLSRIGVWNKKRQEHFLKHCKYWRSDPPS